MTIVKKDIRLPAYDEKDVGGTLSKLIRRLWELFADIYSRLDGGGGTAPVDATYVVVSLDDRLTKERKLTAGTNVTITDGGENGNIVISASGGGGGITSPLTTKGDVWGYSTTDARIPVGSNNQVLTADSTQALGVKWATATGAATSEPFVTIGNTSGLSAERALTAGTAISVTDGGANGNVTVAVTTVPIANGGHGQTTQTAGFDALAPTTTKGDVIAHNGTDNVRVAVGTNNYVLTADSSAAAGVAWTPAYAIPGGPTNAYLFWGNGEDGNAVLDGVNTFTWANLVGSTYTITRNLMLNNLTIDSGINMVTNSMMVMVYGTATINGRLGNYGGDGTVAGVGGLPRNGQYFGGSFQGGVGAVGSGVLGASGSNSIGGNGGNGGGNPAAPSSGGVGGTNSLPAANVGGHQLLYTLYGMQLARMANGNQYSAGAGGGGGGGGVGGATNGGGGGGGGGICGFYARLIAGSGSLSCDGGAGGPGEAPDGAGGGGGGGGCLIVVTTTTNYASLLTVTANGGAGGLAAGGSGQNGSAGLPGRHISLIV